MCPLADLAEGVRGRQKDDRSSSLNNYYTKSLRTIEKLFVFYLEGTIESRTLTRYSVNPLNAQERGIGVVINISGVDFFLKIEDTCRVEYFSVLDRRLDRQARGQRIFQQGRRTLFDRSSKVQGTSTRRKDSSPSEGPAADPRIRGAEGLKKKWVG